MGFKISTIYDGITANNAYVKDLVYINKDEVYKINNDYFIRCVEAYPTKKAYDSGHKPALALAIFHKEDVYRPLFATKIGGEMSDWFGTEEGIKYFNKEVDSIRDKFISNFNRIQDLVERFRENINNTKKDIYVSGDTILYQVYISHTDKGMSGGIKKYVNEVPLARETNDDTQKSMTFDNKEDARKWLKDEFEKTSLEITKENDELEEDYLL